MENNKQIAEIQQPDPAQQDPKIWGESYAYWTQTGVLALAAFIAMIAINSSRTIERKKAAVSALLAAKRDDDLEKASALVASLADGEKNIASFAKAENVKSEESKSIKYVLNYYEYLAVGIGQGIYDESVFKDAMYTILTKLYDRTKPFIDQARKTSGTVTIFQEFECLACKWKLSPLKHKQIVSLPT